MSKSSLKADDTVSKLSKTVKFYHYLRACGLNIVVGVVFELG